MGIFSFVTCIYVVLREQALVLIIQHLLITKVTRCFWKCNWYSSSFNLLVL